MTASPVTVAEVLRAQRNHGDKPLLICDDERLTYDEADVRSTALAARLMMLGVGKGCHVGLLHPNGAAFVVAMLAAARIGAVVVPFSTFSTAAELRRQLRDGDVGVLLAVRSHRGHDYVAALGDAVGAPPTDDPLFSAEVPVLRHIVFGAEDSGTDCDTGGVAGLERDVDGSDVLAVIYTSGSTGDPKGVVHTHASLLTYQRDLNTIRGLTPQDRLFCNSPFFWIGGFAFGLLATLVAGSTLICSVATDAGRTLDLLEAEKPTVTNGFIAGIAHLTRHHSFARRDLSSMRRGNLYPIMAPESRPADPELRHNMLGMTEAGSVVLLSGDESDQPEARRGSYGFLAPGFSARIVDPGAGSDVEGTVGEMLLRGPALMQGYHGRSREECFDSEGWFHTGDLVRRDDDGVFYFVGRAGSMIKTAGANVAPTEVERELAAALQPLHPDASVHVVGLRDSQRGEIVAAVIATDSGTVFDEASVKQALRGRLSAYKIPRRVVTVRRAQVPTLPSGKVDIPALRELFGD